MVMGDNDTSALAHLLTIAHSDAAHPRHVLPYFAEQPPAAYANALGV